MSVKTHPTRKRGRIEKDVYVIVGFKERPTSKAVKEGDATRMNHFGGSIE